MNTEEFKENCEDLIFLVGKPELRDFFFAGCEDMLFDILHEAQSQNYDREGIIKKIQIMKSLLDAQILFLMIEKAEVKGEMGCAGEA